MSERISGWFQRNLQHSTLDLRDFGGIEPDGYCLLLKLEWGCKHYDIIVELKEIKYNPESIVHVSLHPSLHNDCTFLQKS